MIINKKERFRNMQTYTLSQLTEETLKTLVTLREVDGTAETWENMQIALTAKENMIIDYLIKSDAQQRHLSVINEATIWCRAIYPMLRLAEQGHIQAWANVPLKATYPTFRLEGEADGALTPSVGGRIQPPYLLVHEVKADVNAPNPQFQLYGEILTTAWLNWQSDAKPKQRIFGCYTLIDRWNFVLGVVKDIETEKPTLNIEFAPVYNGITDAERIVQLLKFIVAEQSNN